MPPPPARLVELARAPGRRSKLLKPREAAELRAAVDALLERAESWRPPPRGPDDGPPAPDELLLIVLRSKRAANTRRLYARELALFFSFCAEPRPGRVRGPRRARRGLPRTARHARACRASRAVALAAISEYYRRAVHEGAVAANPCAFVRRPAPAAEKQNQARSISRAQADPACSPPRASAPLCTSCSCACCSSTACAPPRPQPPALEDLGEHDGHRILRVRGKGETETNQRVPLNAPTSTALDAWLPERARDRRRHRDRDRGSAAHLAAHRAAAHAPGDPRPRRAPRPQRRCRPP